MEQPGWTQERWSTLWDKLETCTSIGPEPWEAEDPMGVLKYWGEFVQTPQKLSKEWLVHAGSAAECLLFAYKVAVEKNTELKTVKQDRDIKHLSANIMLQRQALVAAAAALQSEISGV